MVIRPVYNILLLPDVSYYFKKEFFSGFGGESIEAGSDILFIFLKNEKESGFTPEDFYPIGLSARAEGFGDEDAVSVRTLNRVDLSDLQISDDQITLSASIRPDTETCPTQRPDSSLQNSAQHFSGSSRVTSGDSGRGASSFSGRTSMILHARWRII